MEGEVAGLPGTRDADTAQNVAASEALADTFEKERRALLRVRLVAELAETLVAGGDGEAEAGVEETAGVDLVKAVQLVRLVRAHGGSTSWKKTSNYCNSVRNASEKNLTWH